MKTSLRTRISRRPATVLGEAESMPEALLLNRIQRHGLPKPETQVQLIEGRRFRYDVVFRQWKVAVEVQGGIWSGGAHVRGQGYEANAVKSALAQIEGYICLYVTPGQINDNTAVFLIDRALRSRGWPS